MEATDEHKKSHLQAMQKADLEAIYAALAPAADETATDADTEVANDTDVATSADAPTDTAAEEPAANDVTPDENEQKVLATIPTLEAFSGTDAELIGRDLLKKVEKLHNIPFATGRKYYRSLRKKGYYTSKGKAEGKTFTTIQLTELGVQYLTDNNLLTAPAADAAPSVDAPVEVVFDAKIWLDDLKADYGDITSEMLDELVNTEILTQNQAEEIYELSNKAA